jgi:hypothetical protein
MRLIARVNNRIDTAYARIDLGAFGLRLRAVHARLPRGGDSVTFVPEPTPAGATVQVLQWWYVGASGWRRLTECGTRPTCRTLVTGAGRGVVFATVNGSEFQTDARVTIDTCVTGDPVLDSLPTRDTLLAELERSQPSAQHPRRERGGLIVQRANGSIDVVPQPLAVGTDCSVGIENSPSAAGLRPGDAIIAVYHTHPHEQSSVGPFGVLQTDSARFCRDKNGNLYNKWMPVDPHANGGGSDADWHSARVWPNYIFSQHGEVFRLDPTVANGTAAAKAGNASRYWWKQTTHTPSNRQPVCAW